MPRKRIRDLKIPYWIVDGINGILALIIYNFLLFIFRVTEIGGIFGQIEDIMGYFGANLFIRLDFSKPAIMLGIISIFLFSFMLGTGIALLIRILKRERLEP
ncbi:MAG: hypothetical protein ABIB79_02450 [archaeon]